MNASRYENKSYFFILKKFLLDLKKIKLNEKYLARNKRKKKMKKKFLD